MVENLNKKSNILIKILLVICNIFLVLFAVLFAVYYSNDIRTQQSENMLEKFKDNVETMKSISEQYMERELSVAKSYARYINQNNLSLEEAITYISSIDDEDYEANLVDLETYFAWSTVYDNGSNEIYIYHDWYLRQDEYQNNIELMEKMYNGEKVILSKYIVGSIQRIVVSVGTRIDLSSEDGGTKRFLLLRVIPVTKLNELWLFPTTFSSAEVGLITRNSYYIVDSYSMRNTSFLEYVSSYNFNNDYNSAKNFLSQIKNEESGLMTLKDFRGRDCYFYYSQLEGFLDADILGYILISDLVYNVENISIVLVVVGVSALIVLIDGLYILSINRRLRETAVIADKANRSKTQFLSTMSHDIRTPLNAVLGMTELAQSKIDDQEYVKECLRKISVSGNHLLTLINVVLEISRVESGKIAINPGPFDVNMMISSIESIVRSQATGHGLIFEVNSDVPYETLIGDKLRLTQILLNLLNNAVKYTKAGGRVSLDVREDNINDGKLDLVCIIKDNGVGMSKEFQKKMYDSFTRVSDARIDKIQGTGLGLAIVKSLVDIMNGTIVCESDVNQGTQFTIRINLSIAKNEIKDDSLETAVSNESAGDLKGIHVLIAEDNELNWEIISSMLDPYGIVCTRAENGRECVDIITSQIPGTFDLVLMDIQMPVLNGLDATRELRSSDRLDLQQIPIVAMTADAFAEDVQNCIDAGMNAHVAKPIEIEKVITTIRLLLTRNGSL